MNQDSAHFTSTKTLIFILILLFTLSFSVNGQQTNSTVAQETQSDDSTPEVAAATVEKRYLVEVIVFNYIGPISANGEIWHRTPHIEFSPESYKSELSAEDEAASDPAEEVEGPVEFTELKELLPFLSKLLADRRYEIVTYSAWTQPLYGKKDSIRVDLVPRFDHGSGVEAAPFYGPPIEGSLQLFDNRLLFVDLDLKNKLNVIEAGGQFDVGPTEAVRPAGTFRIQEKRRVKLNEVHYFDHPFFGALVRVSRA